VGGQFGSALEAIPVGEGLMLCSGQITVSAKLTTSAVPANHCAETGNGALNLGCVTIRVVIAAQWASGIPSQYATISDTIVATAVRSEYVTDEGSSLRRLTFAVSRSSYTHVLYIVSLG
jgi:hypothetical protein